MGSGDGQADEAVGVSRGAGEEQRERGRGRTGGVGWERRAVGKAEGEKRELGDEAGTVRSEKRERCGGE